MCLDHPDKVIKAAIIDIVPTLDMWAAMDKDAAIGGRLVELVGDPCYRAPLVLEGGSICVDGEGTLITTEQCLLHPTRNPDLSREQAISSRWSRWGCCTAPALGRRA